VSERERRCQQGSTMTAPADPDKLDKLSTGAPPPAPPAGAAVEAPLAVAGGPGLSARRTADMASPARGEGRTWRAVHGDEGGVEAI
jgi:hypothetical protein